MGKTTACVGNLMGILNRREFTQKITHAHGGEVKMPLTIKGIEAAKAKYNAICGKYVQTKLSDGDGLFLIITEKTKSWRARYFYMGKEQTLSLGKYPLVSLKDAREKNFMLRQELDKGINPAEEKKKEKAQIKAVVQEERRIANGEDHPLSFKAIAEDWLADVKKNWKESTYRAEKKRIRKDLIGPFGHRMITDITPSDVRTVFQALERQGKFDTLRKIAENCVRIFNFAIAVGKCENNPAYSIWKGLSFAKPPKQRSFPTITDPDRVGKLLLDIENYKPSNQGLEVAMALKIAPYVFLRPGTLVSGEWSEIHWEEKEWHIPGEKMKNSKPHVVPLATQVFALLKTLYGFTGEGRYMFPSWGRQGHITNNALLKFYKNLGYKGEMCSHGLRHLAVTSLKELRFERDVIYLQMSHTLESSQSKATYDKTQLLPQRTAMMQAYADYLNGLREKAKAAVGMTQDK